MIYSTIAITLYRRPIYTKQLFDALKQCYGLEGLPITISCDYSAEYEDAADCDAVIGLAEEFSRSMDKGQVHIYVNRPKRGIDQNKLFVVPKALERMYGQEQSNYVIFFEDDTIPRSKDTLNWFIAMGMLYHGRPEVLSVTGYNRIIDEKAWAAAKRFDLYGIEFQEGFGSWSWAMWADRWWEFFKNDGASYRAYAGALVDGKFDWWLRGIVQKKMIAPRCARVQSVGGEKGEHTPGTAWHQEHEFNEHGAWEVELPDWGVAPWLSRGWQRLLK